MLVTWKKVALSIMVIPLFLVGITACGSKEEKEEPMAKEDDTEEVVVEEDINKLTENEEAAAEIFRRIYYQMDDEAAMELVDPDQRNNPFVTAIIEVDVDLTKENPIEEQTLQVLTLEQKHVGETIIVYHPEMTMSVIVRDKQVRAIESKERVPWDVLNDDIDTLYPYLLDGWKEASAE